VRKAKPERNALAPPTSSAAEGSLVGRGFSHDSTCLQCALAPEERSGSFPRPGAIFVLLGRHEPTPPLSFRAEQADFSSRSLPHAFCVPDDFTGRTVGLRSRGPLPLAVCAWRISRGGCVWFFDSSGLNPETLEARILIERACLAAARFRSLRAQTWKTTRTA
jgi:hypothetical protein